MNTRAENSHPNSECGIGVGTAYLSGLVTLRSYPDLRSSSSLHVIACLLGLMLLEMLLYGDLSAAVLCNCELNRISFIVMVVLFS